VKSGEAWSEDDCGGPNLVFVSEQRITLANTLEPHFSSSSIRLIYCFQMLTSSVISAHKVRFTFCALGTEQEILPGTIK
jgi:hypothetical protein